MTDDDAADQRHQRRIHSMGVGGDKATAVGALARQLKIEQALRAGPTREPRPAFVGEESSPPTATAALIDGARKAGDDSPKSLAIPSGMHSEPKSEFIGLQQPNPGMNPMEIPEGLSDGY